MKNIGNYTEAESLDGLNFPAFSGDTMFKVPASLFGAVGGNVKITQVFTGGTGLMAVIEKCNIGDFLIIEYVYSEPDYFASAVVSLSSTFINVMTTYNNSGTVDMQGLSVYIDENDTTVSTTETSILNIWRVQIISGEE